MARVFGAEQQQRLLPFPGATDSGMVTGFTVGAMKFANAMPQVLWKNLTVLLRRSMWMVRGRQGVADLA